MSKFFEYVIIVALTVLCIGTAWMMAPTGPSEDDVKLAQQRIALSTAKKAAVAKIPDLPPLPDLWQRINIDFGYCGLKVLEGTQPAPGDPTMAGQPSFWVGQVSGTSGVGMTCILDAARRYPIRVVGLRVNPKEYYVRYRVYGVLNPTVITPSLPDQPKNKL